MRLCASVIACLAIHTPAFALDGPNQQCGKTLSHENMAILIAATEAALAIPPAPVAEIVSAGSVELNEQVKESRKAFHGLDQIRTLAVAWHVTRNHRFLEAVDHGLLGWAHTYKPSGHPINESRLEALIIAYQLTKTALPLSTKTAMDTLLRQQISALEAWSFGPLTDRNNHRTHQMKMLLMLNDALGNYSRFDELKDDALEHLKDNVNPNTGETVDLAERSALYYHTYNLEAWLEIAWLTGELWSPISLAVELLESRIINKQTSGEFERSVSSLDQTRANAGFGYGGAGTNYSPKQAERVIAVYHHLSNSPTPPELASILPEHPNDAMLYYTLRNNLCHTRQ